MSYIGRIDPQGPSMMPEVNAAALGNIKALLRPVFLSSGDDLELARRLDRRGFMLRSHDRKPYVATAPHGKLVCQVSEITAY